MAEAPSRKVCFVTIGATAPFNSLLSHVFDLQFLEALSKHGYTDLLVQYGREGKALFDRFIQAYPVGSSGRCGLRIHGFDFNKEGLQKEMMLTRADSKSNTAEGMILSHAGSHPLHSEGTSSPTLMAPHHRVRVYNGSVTNRSAVSRRTKSRAGR